MGRGKDLFIEKTGGLHFGESEEEFHARVAEIEKLEKELMSGKLSMEELETVQRKLCALKGIDFDAPDEF